MDHGALRLERDRNGPGTVRIFCSGPLRNALLFATGGTSFAAVPAPFRAPATAACANLSARRDKVQDLVAFGGRAGHGTGSDRGASHLFDDRQRPDRVVRQAQPRQDHGQVRGGFSGTSRPASTYAAIMRPNRRERPDSSVVLCRISRHETHPICAAASVEGSPPRAARRRSRLGQGRRYCPSFWFHGAGALRRDIPGYIWRGPIDHSSADSRNATGHSVNFPNFCIVDETPTV